MLDDTVKADIQTAYRTWLGSRDFRARRSQRQMIASIANAIAGSVDGRRFCVVEAGTGVGKTVAYLLALLPLARRLRKRIVLATATVALQEQLVLRDLPDLMRHSGLKFSWSLAKGRRRYVCVQQLDAHLRAPAQASFEAVGSADLSADAGPLYSRLLNDLVSGRWDGDRDALVETVEEPVWQRVTTDGRGCTGKRCGFFRQCPYFAARESHEDADVIVANHDLVLADLAVGGAVLPDPEDTIYVFDEAHHLPQKAQNHFQASARLRSTRDWLDVVNTALGTMAQRFGQATEFTGPAQAVAALTGGIAEEIDVVLQLTEQLPFDAANDGRLTRFEHGRLPADLAGAATPLMRSLGALNQLLDETAGRLQKVMDGDLVVVNAQDADSFYAALASLTARAESAWKLAEDYAGAAGVAAADAPPYARWVRRTDDEDFLLASAPIVAAEHLFERIWSVAYGAVLTSATVRSLGRFEPFLASTGLPEETDCVQLPSPFDYPRLGVLRVPAMRSDGGSRDAHTREVGELLPELLSANEAALVLFTSWRQMRDVFEAMPRAMRDDILMQGQHSRQYILDNHRQRVDDKQRSIIFGLASFGEGIDLPGGYVSHVIIAKLPFAVPDDPMALAHAEWVEARGGNAFMEVSVPEASLKLTQACGRLIRSEKDHGAITLLDRRIVSRRYGQAMLEALPPFSREIG